MNQRDFLAAVLLTTLLGSCQSGKEKVKMGEYPVGFEVIKWVDSTRVYKPNTATTHPLHFRPIDVDVWYPATETGLDSALSFGYFLGLLEERAAVYSAPASAKGLARQVATYFCEGMKCSTPEKVLAYQTNSRQGLKKSPNRFPLVVYLTGYNGMGYENCLLLEKLASAGYVVVSISSIGRYPGDMTMQQPDLMEQVYDAEFVLSRMNKMTSVDSTRVGLIGYSWGGLAGAVLALTRPDLKTLVSFEGSEFHHYGTDKKEDALFDEIINQARLRNRVIRIPYLRLESGPEKNSQPAKPIYNFNQKLAGKNQRIRLRGATHEDFSAIPFLTKKSGNCPTDSLYEQVFRITLQHFREML